MLTGKYLNECLKKYSRFQLIHMVSRRVHELQNGAKPLVNARMVSPTEIALQEIAEGKILAYTPEKKTDSVEETKKES